MIFNRVMCENSFYGLITGAYLAWVSVFYGLSQNFNGFNAFGALIVILSWLGFVILFCMVDSSILNISEDGKNPTMILKGFSQFTDVFRQVSKKESNEKPAAERFYIFMMLERVLTSAIIVLAPSMLPMPNLFIVGVHTIMMAGLIIMHVKTQSGLPDDERKGLFSHIYKNYTLRQIINLLLSISIQLVLCYSQMEIDWIKTSSDMIEMASFIGITAPTIYSALLVVCLVFTIFFWIWEIKNDNIAQKGNQLLRLLFDIPKPEEIDALTKSIIENVK